MRVGNYSVPDIRLFPKVYEWITKLYEAYKLEEISNNVIAAQICGHKSANSGAWISKLADFRSYGLMEPRNLKLTQLAEKLTYGTDDERVWATSEAVLNVPLWKELNSRFGTRLPETNFWVQLQRITGLDPMESQKYAEAVRKAYLEDISHVEIIKISKSIEVSMPNPSVSSMGTINVQVGPFSQTTPFTDEGINLAIGFLNLLRSQAKKEIPKAEEE